MENLARILEEHPFIKGLEPKYIDLLVGCASNVRFDPEAFVFRQGEEADQFYLIRQGRIALAIHSEIYGPITIQTLEKGDILGWSWLVPPHYRHFDAQVLEQTRVIAFDGKCLRTKCQEDKSLGYELLMRMVPLMGQRLEATRLKLQDVFKAKH
jgi:CRP/FNR family transcriptional regulator, cyclic AMP receptor protein